MLFFKAESVGRSSGLVQIILFDQRADFEVWQRLTCRFLVVVSCSKRCPLAVV